MKKFILIASIAAIVNCYSNTVLAQTTTKPKQPVTRTAKKPTTTSTTGKTPATFPNTNPPTKNIVYQYIDTAYPNSENHFPVTGNAGIGTNTPQAALEIRRNAGDTKKKNVLLQLSNEWSPNGQNEPSILFSNGDNSSPANVSYWTIGARVSGDKTLNTPQTFKISFKAPGSGFEQEYFSINSYQGKVKIGDVNDLIDGYKLFVEQGILTEKVKVAVKNSEDWFDNVLNKDYQLMPLNSLSKYIQEHQHLPDMPTTSEVMKDGLDLGKMNGLLLKKVEELTLYILDMKKDADETKKQLEELKKQLEDFKNQPAKK
jgi:hypothetical protein